jgi:hypothetical protein
MSLRERAEAELNNELAALVQHDNVTYPVSSDTADAGAGSNKKRKKDKQADAASMQQLVPKGPPLMQFSLHEMDAARKLLAAEVEVVKGAMGHSSFGQAEYVEAWRVVVDDFVVDDKVRRGGCGQQERGRGRALATEG